jgi:hypothetical protein
MYVQANVEREQRPSSMPILHGLYVKPLSIRRLVNAFVSSFHNTDTEANQMSHGFHLRQGDSSIG